MVEVNITEILLALLQKYGLIVVFLGFCIWSIRGIEYKIDRLINLNNKTFGVMLALVDSEKRKNINSNVERGHDD